MDICFEGIGQTTATFQAEGEIRPGMVVALAENGAAAPGGAGGAPCGVALGGVRGGAVAVREHRPRAGLAGAGLRRTGRREDGGGRNQIPGAGGGRPGQERGCEAVKQRPGFAART